MPGKHLESENRKRLPSLMYNRAKVASGLYCPCTVHILFAVFTD